MNATEKIGGRRPVVASRRWTAPRGVPRGGRWVFFFAFCLAWLCASSIAGAATNYGVAKFDLHQCRRGQLAPAAPEGVLVALCEAREGEPTKKSLGTVLPDGKLRRRPLPPGATGPFAVGPGGDIWAATGTGSANLGIDRIAADGSVARVALGTAREADALEVYGLVADERGSVWIATGELALDYFAQPYNSTGGEIVRVDADGTVTRFPVPEDVEPQAIVRGPDGNLWFAGESGRAVGEHVSYLGKGYVGRLTPAGEFTLFPTVSEESAPGGLAVGPDGRLWFTAGKYFREIATIGTDGVFGSGVKVGGLRALLGFGADGNAWVSTFDGIARVTAWGQRTVFPIPRAHDLVVGAEGDIWTSGPGSLERIVPGAPGIEAREIEADRRSKKIRFALACGGSEQGCTGDLTLSLSRGRGTRPGPRLLRTRYTVLAESHRGLTVDLPAEAFSLARAAVPGGAGAAYVASVVLHVSVAGGPPLDRRFRVPGLVPGQAR